MKITHLKINHLVNPLGNALPAPRVSYIVEETDGIRQECARFEAALDEAFTEPVFDSGWQKDIDSTAYPLPFKPEPCTRYYWRVSVKADNGDSAVSDPAWFETPKEDEWQADWITPDCPKELQVVLYRDIRVDGSAHGGVKQARMYMTGLGVYELMINGEMAGDECLLPGFVPYDCYIPFQTFEVELKEGENRIEIVLGDGWYKGRFGLRKHYEVYGDRLAAIGELHIRYADGTEETVCTDTKWHARPSYIVRSGIYPGEFQDMTADVSREIPVKVFDLDKGKLTPRRNPRLRIQETIKPVEVIRTPKGETVLDMGQNMVGWFGFHSKLPAGAHAAFEAGEILQEGNFYRDNLRTAEARFDYVSDGVERDVRQHFTFYGFRYLKVTGWPEPLDPSDFTGFVIYSDIEETGFIETSEPLVNKLFVNAKWGQKGNFLDVPTDCPQRDERCGWTGDAQVFSGTALFNTDAAAFYLKYGYDISCEQVKYDGGVPDTVPIAGNEPTVSTAWGEAATIIPWNVYLATGDAGVLEDRFDSMKGWVDYIKREDDKYGAKRLWQTGFHYGDWLALDGAVQGGVFGRTDPYFIASAYYYYSTRIVQQAAGVLGRMEDRVRYGRLADEIRQAFFQEYYSPNGRLCVDTMTAYTVVLYMGLVPQGALPLVREGLLEKLRKNRYHLETGFVGTPYLCRVLSENGMNDLAYHLLMEKGYPGWLYEVLMGATTVWERWNSVLPDGKISGIEMNSLNHYAYGSIVEWMYRNMIGIRPLARAYMRDDFTNEPWMLKESAGYRKFRIAPEPNWRLAWAKGDYRSACGNIHSEWKIEDGGKKLYFCIGVPFGAECELVLPDARADAVEVNAKTGGGVSRIRQDGTKVRMSLTAGNYEFSYEPTVPYRKIYNLDSSMEELLACESTKRVLEEDFFSVHGALPFFKELYTLRETLNSPFLNLPYDVQEKMDKKLRECV